jgi:hypothetical protein
MGTAKEEATSYQFPQRSETQKSPRMAGKVFRRKKAPIARGLGFSYG